MFLVMDVARRRGEGRERGGEGCTGPCARSSVINGGGGGGGGGAGAASVPGEMPRDDYFLFS